MLLASYGHSEAASESLLSYSIGMGEVGADASIVDPLGRLEGLPEFRFVVTSPIGHTSLNAVGVIEMPDGSYFASVPETVPEETRGLLVGSHLMNYLAGLNFRDVLSSTLNRLGDRREEFARIASFTTASAYYALKDADSIDLLHQTGEPLGVSLKALRQSAGETFEHITVVKQFNQGLKRGEQVELPRLGVSLSLGETRTVKAFVDGMEVQNTTLALEPARELNKPHICINCHMAVSPSRHRLTIGTRAQSGFNHHHFHAFCASVALG